MKTYDIILKKRHGQELSVQEIRFMVEGFIEAQIADYQMASFLMAIATKGFTSQETYHLTMSMRDSGALIDLDPLKGSKIDKHSTGGVGDKVSLVLAPLVASLGIIDPMISGRGLAHACGTLDKLESIPGYNVGLSRTEFIRVLKKTGVAITGQTDEVNPADKKIFALRNLTATVDSIPLIASSIMSKKLVVSLDGLLLDITVGNGAFMQTIKDALSLAKTMVDIGHLAGCKVTAYITDMNQPRGNAAGTALEVKEAIETLKGRGPADFRELCLEYGTEMMLLAGKGKNKPSCRQRLEKVLSSGAALDKFRQMVEVQGGNPAVIDDPSLLSTAKQKLEIKSRKSGFIQKIDTLKIGQTIVSLGAGRLTKEASLDFGVGLEMYKKIGDRVESGDVLALLYINDVSQVKSSKEAIHSAFKIGRGRIVPPPLIYYKVTKDRVEKYKKRGQ